MTIAEFDQLSGAEKRAELLKCCGSSLWADKMLTVFPVEDLVDLLQYAEEKWAECTGQDWLEAFSHHPKIGDLDSLKQKFASTANWASNEQSGINSASEAILNELAQGNNRYEEKFGFIFIVFATGKSAAEILSLLVVRLQNSREEEIKLAADEQSKITNLRLKKLFE